MYMQYEVSLIYECFQYCQVFDAASYSANDSIEYLVMMRRIKRSLFVCLISLQTLLAS